MKAVFKIDGTYKNVERETMKECCREILRNYDSFVGEVDFWIRHGKTERIYKRVSAPAIRNIANYTLKVYNLLQGEGRTEMIFTKEELNEKIEELEAEREALENAEESQEFDDCLDAEGDVEIGCCAFSRSRILKELDPIAYRTGLLDFNDDRLSEIESEIEDLKSELTELENEETD